MYRLVSRTSALVTAATLSIVLQLPATAANDPLLPDWRISKICKTDSATPYCLADEGIAKRNVAGAWSLMPPAWRSACLTEFKPPLEPSWRILSDCLQRQAVAAADARRRAKDKAEEDALEALTKDRAAARQREIDARRAAEAKRKAEEAARIAAAEAARKAAEDEARRRAEEEAERLRLAAEAKRKAEEEARAAAAKEAARLAAAEAARKAAEDEARRKAEQEAERLRLAAEAERKAEEAARLAAAEAARKKAEEEARKRADAEAARLKVEAEAKRAAELAAAESARKAAEDEARLKAEKEAARAKAEADAKKAQEEEAQRQQLAAAQAARRVASECQDRISAVRKEGVINFETNSWDLTSTSNATLDQISSIAKDCPNANITVRGHTDSTGPSNTNQQLSELRAQSVVDYLKSKGVTAGRLTAVGVGEAEPIDNNTTRAGRARNRRIEFVIQ